jgi:hypothetical protein
MKVVWADRWFGGKMPLSTISLTTLLRRLQQEQTESRTIDGKQDLPLQEDGDKAFFLRHVAALANNVEPSYLLLGVEDRTWRAIGLPATSSLLKADDTQQQMNQILQRRLEPAVHLRYQVHEVDGVPLGLVEIVGERAPYVISVPRYGGPRTRGAPEFVHQGVIYWRDGSSSVPISRQSDLMGILQRAGQASAPPPDPFLEEGNYLRSVEDREFGRRQELADLQEPREGEEPPDPQPPSWVSFVFYPLTPGVKLPLIDLRPQLIGPLPSTALWYDALPRPIRFMLELNRPTPRRWVARYQSDRVARAGAVTHQLRILDSGHIELAVTYPLFAHHDEGKRCFYPLFLVGYLWQMIYLARRVYQFVRYEGDVGLLVNLVGSQGAYLKFGSGDPLFDDEEQQREVCPDLNISVARALAITQMGDDEIEAMVRDVCLEASAYFGPGFATFWRMRGEFPARDYWRLASNMR